MSIESDTTLPYGDQTLSRASAAALGQGVSPIEVATTQVHTDPCYEILK